MKKDELEQIPIYRVAKPPKYAELLAFYEHCSILIAEYGLGDRSAKDVTKCLEKALSHLE